MNVLAFDTCLGAVSVAVLSRCPEGTLMRDAFEIRDRGHAERLMPMIAEVMAEAGLAFADIDRIAVTTGPGSFTGVRVGIAAARGLALASGRPVVAATSLAVMAQQAAALLDQGRAARLLAVALDARRGMVFLQLFDAAHGELGPPVLLAPEGVPALVEGRPVMVVGSAAGAVAEAINAAGGNAQALLPDLQPRARALAQMADRLAPVSPLRPLYLRPPDVKPQADKSLARAVP
jgi:tRNA threonylcarbamoyladenosine biosynthesis protein TsaB